MMDVKKTDSDLSVQIESDVLKYASLRFKFKNNINAGYNASFSLSFKVLKGCTADEKKKISAINTVLKNKNINFSITPVNISGAKSVTGKINKDGTNATSVVVKVNGREYQYRVLLWFY